MGGWFDMVLLGLGVGATYALAALGIVLVYRGSGIVNFAQAGMAIVGAYMYNELNHDGWATVPAIAAGLAATALLGALVHNVVMRPLRGASPLIRLVATLGLLTAIQGAATLIYGADSISFASPLFSTANVRILGGSVPAEQLWLFAIAVGLTVVLWAVYRFTTFGVVTSAVAENYLAASSLGRSPELVATINWALGSALAGLAGILIIPITGLSVTQLSLLLYPALAGALVGGFSSFMLALLGGLAIGIGQSELTRYVSAAGWATAFPFLVIVAVLVVRGKSLPLRSFVLDRLPAVGSGRVRPRLLVAVIAGVSVAIALSTNLWADAEVVTATSAIVALSLVVVTGYAGQVSLAQYAFAGVGALISAQLAANVGLPFVVALILAVLATIPVGLIVGVPAVRTRGVNLAIATLGLALAIESVVLGNPTYTGGLEGLVVTPPSIFGLSFNAAAHPQRYALLCFGCFVAVGLVVANLRRGRTGRRLLAVRANERAAASLGISVPGGKLYAFGLGAAIAAVGGVLLAFRTPNVTFDAYSVQSSINAVVVTVIGGIGFIGGVLPGALSNPGGVIATAFNQVFDWAQYFALASGLLLIIALIQAPDGAVKQMSDIVSRLGRKSGRPETRPEVPELGSSTLTPRTGTLEVRDMSVRFGGVVALDGFSLTVEPGRIVGLIGPNGAGKTTFIDAVTGFTRCSGSVLIDGRDMRGASPRRRALAGLGRSFQSVELFEDLTVADNLEVASDEHHAWTYLTDLVHPGRTALSPAAIVAIDEFELGDALDRRPSELPFARRRLVGIARAIAAGRGILLLDEPAAGLDEVESRELGLLLRRMAAEWKLAILLVEHDVELVMGVCDEVAVLEFGRKIAHGTPDEVRRDPAVVAAYLGESEEPVAVPAVGARATEVRS